MTRLAIALAAGALLLTACGNGTDDTTSIQPIEYRVLHADCGGADGGGADGGGFGIDLDNGAVSSAP